MIIKRKKKKKKGNKKSENGKYVNFEVIEQEHLQEF